MRENAGFTLIELSLVLVIIGLLVSGIMVGTHLIEAARTRGVVREINQYQQAYISFTNKYKALPGDMQEFAKFFPTMNTSVFYPGNADATIIWDAEGPEAWVEMDLAQLIPVSIANTKTQACGFNCDAVPGVTIPKSRAIDSAGWTVGVSSTTGQNVFLYGAAVSLLAYAPVLTGAQTFIIDEKVDDAKPESGKMRARNAYGYDDCLTQGANIYVMNSNQKVCAFEIGVGR